MYVVVIASLPQFPFSWKNITGTWGRNCWGKKGGGGVGGVGEKVVVGITNDCTPQYRNFYTRSKPLYIILSALSKLSFLWVDVFCGDSVRHCWLKLDLKTFFCCAVELCFFFTYTTKVPPPPPPQATKSHPRNVNATIYVIIDWNSSSIWLWPVLCLLMIYCFSWL